MISTVALFTLPKLSIFIGFWVAFVHVLTGPDHLAAVTPLVLESKKKYWVIGFLWGLGHLLGMLLIGVLYMLFKDQIPIEQISAHSEQLVGFILILLGIWSFFRIYHDKKKHIHPHIHNQNEKEFIHIHKHEHQKSSHTHQHESKPIQNKWTSFGVGIIHGFAGVAHFLLLLPILGFSFSQGLQYIIGFALGTVIAMTIFSFIIGQISYFSKQHNEKKLFNTIRIIGGLISIVVGILWILYI